MSHEFESLKSPKNPLSEAVTGLLVDPDALSGAVPATQANGTHAADADDAASAKRKWKSHELKISDAERRQLSTLKKRAVYLCGPVKKSELLRAGLHALSHMGDDALSALLAEFKATAEPSRKQGKRHNGA